MTKKKYCSFFTGAMGLDLGLESLGWELISANEINPDALKTIKNHREKKSLNFEVFDESIVDLDANMMRERIGDRLSPEEEIFCVVGGPPCQSFSTMGKGLGLEDSRGNLTLRFIQLALDLNPKFIVMENVRGIYTAKGPSYYENKGGLLTCIVDLLEARGYKTNFDLYDMSLYGVPQRRERMILVASKDHTVPLLNITHSDNSKLSLAPLKTTREALEAVDIGDYTSFSKEKVELLSYIKSGQNWKNLPSVELQKRCLKGAFNSGGGKTGYLRRVDWGKPSPTLLCSPTQNSTLLAHPELNRPLSTGEYKRLATFPDDFEVKGKVAAQYKQIGNSIPPLFGAVIGQLIERIDSGEKIIENEQARSRYKKTTKKDFLGRDS